MYVTAVDLKPGGRVCSPIGTFLTATTGAKSLFVPVQVEQENGQEQGC